MAQETSCAHEERHEIALSNGIQERKRLVADPVPAESWVGVGGVGGRLQPHRSAQRMGLGPAQAEDRMQRTGLDPCQAGGTGAAQECEQHRLGLIVGGVTVEGVRSQDSSSFRSTPSFEVGSVAELCVFDAKCDIEYPGDAPRDLGIAVCRFAHAVVDVDGGDVVTRCSGENQQRGGVGTSRERAGDWTSVGEGAADQQLAGQRNVAD